MADRRHVVTVVVQGAQIGGWIDYEIESSMVQAADVFTLRRPFDAKVWAALPRDGQVRILIDGVVIVRGFIDSRKAIAKTGLLEIHGRDAVGRLVQDSAPSISYAGLPITEAVRRLASPWFDRVTLSDKRNRDARRGKGRKVAAAKEPMARGDGSARSGSVHPGQTRWAVISEIVSRARLAVWSSADGRELVIGQPNYDQAPQFLIAYVEPSSAFTTVRNTTKDLIYLEDNGDRFSEITVVGHGGNADDYGVNAVDRRAVYADGDGTYGVGRDFIYPKRMMMSERSFEGNEDAQRIAAREVARRDFGRASYHAEVEGFGQFISGGAPTLYAPNTIARVVDSRYRRDEPWMIHGCHYSGSREGESTSLDLVPNGTEIVA